MIVAIDLGRYPFDASLLEQVQVQYSANVAVASSNGALYAVVRDGAGTGFSSFASTRRLAPPAFSRPLLPTYPSGSGRWPPRPARSRSCFLTSRSWSVSRQASADTPNAHQVTMAGSS